MSTTQRKPDAITIASDLIQGLSSSGATVWLAPERADGYLVGIPRFTLDFQSLGHVDHAATVVWLWRVAAYVRTGEIATVGSWIDPATGEVAFDACDWTEDRDTALALGAYCGETAIWDVAAGEAITVDRVKRPARGIRPDTLNEYLNTTETEGN